MSASGYVWYSSGSDVTGPKLAEALGFKHGKGTPDFDALDVLVNWGCRAEKRKKYDADVLRDKIASGDLRVLNHPQRIAEARNKMALLYTLRSQGVQVPGFLQVEGQHPSVAISELKKAVDEGRLLLPCVGMNRFNRGRPIFCWTKEDLEKAVVQLAGGIGEGESKVDYFRSLLQGTEYRIQIFREEAISGEVKKLSKDPVASSAAQLLEELKKKNLQETHTTEEEMRIIVSILAEDLLSGPSHMLKSVQHGWEWSPQPVTELPAQAISAAILAVTAAGLDMGAVNVIVEEGQALVTNVIAAPALREHALAAYTEAIKDFSQGGAPKKKKEAVKEQGAEVIEGAPKVEAEVPPEIVARITRKIRLGKLTKEKAEEILKALE